ncbi:MAG: tripartite tricarboxylate transporter permease [Pseudomonadota bacterium]
MDLVTTALPALAEAFSLILTPSAIMYLVTGVLLGLCVGVFPGLGGIAGLSMVLPFIYGMDPVSGLSLMVGLVAVIPTSDTFASVLLGIPGSSASQATVLDGFPLSKKGQAAKALAAAFTSSLFGGIFGAIILTFFILIARPLVLAFGVPELLLLTILGFSMVGVLAGRSMVKGLIAVGLGMTVGAIGEAPAQGSPRMDFGSWYLQDGFSLVIVGLGIFAIPEIISLLRQDRAIAEEAKLGAGWWDGVAAWWQNRWLSLRCAAIGVVVGVVPGLGGSVVDWIAYGHSVQTTKDRSQFGKGEIRGVIGPESSNNAKEGGGLVPTLLFGIPGSGSMAVFIGGMILLGYEAGPQMVRDDLPITYTVVWSLALANVVGAGLCIFLSGGIAKLTTIRFPLLAPFLFMMISFAAFQSKQTSLDLAALVAVGILGIFLRRFEWSRPAFLIGFVLADQAEVYAYQATQIAMLKGKTGGPAGMLEYLFSPVSIVLILIIAVSVWLGARQSKAIHASEEEAGDTAPTGSKRAPFLFALAVTAFLALAFADAMSVRVLIDKVFPATVAGLSLFAAIILLIRMRLMPEGHFLFVDNEVTGEDATAPHSLWITLGWFLSLLALTALFGFVIALTVFFVAFLAVRAKAPPAMIAILTAGGVGFVVMMAYLLNRDFPPGMLQELVELPWPFSGL